MKILLSPIMLSTAAFWFWDMKQNSSDSITSALMHMKDIDVKIDGIDIAHPFRNNDTALKLPDWAEAYLISFKYRTLHTSFDDLKPDIPLLQKDIKNRLTQIKITCQRYEITDFVLHANLLNGCLSWMPLMLMEVLSGININLEFMDKNKSFGNKPEHFIKIFSKYENFKLVLDCAHLQDFSGQFHWTEFTNNSILRERINFIHVSNHANHSNNKQAPYEYRGRMTIAKHQLCQAALDRLDNEILACTNGVPRIIEGAVPASEEGVDLLKREITFFRNN